MLIGREIECSWFLWQRTGKHGLITGTGAKLYWTHKKGNWCTASMLAVSSSLRMVHFCKGASLFLAIVCGWKLQYLPRFNAWVRQELVHRKVFLAQNEAMFEWARFKQVRWQRSVRFCVCSRTEWQAVRVLCMQKAVGVASSLAEQFWYRHYFCSP